MGLAGSTGFLYSAFMERANHAFFAGSGSPAAAPAALRGRGAVTNVAHRFLQTERAPADDGWASTHLPPDNLEGPGAVTADATGQASGASRAPGARHIPIAAEPPVLKTSVQAEQARKLLSRNDSPDIP